MRFRSRRRAVPAVLAALCAAGALAAAAAGAPARKVRFASRPPSTATRRSGPRRRSTSTLRLDPRRLTRAPLTEVRFAYPRSLGLVSSGLGLAACTRPASDFAQVLITAPGLGGCPPNAVMGVGTALALVRLNNGQTIPSTRP